MRKLNVVHLSFKILHLVATILMIFLRIDLPNSVQFEQYYGKILSMIKGLGAKPLKPPRKLGPCRHALTVA